MTSPVTRWLNRHVGHTWATNYNDRRGGPKGPIWQYGAYHVRLGRSEEHDAAMLSLAWRLAWHRWSNAAFEIEVGGDNDHDVQLHVAWPCVSLFCSLEWRRLRTWAYKVITGYGSRTTGVRVFSGAIWWQVWYDDSVWSSRDPAWRRGAFHVDNAVLGKMRHEKRLVEGPVDVEIPLPEGTYRGTATLTAITNKRPRWPWAERFIRGEIEVENPPAVPGKGENSWDLGDDAIFSLTTEARNVPMLIGKYVASVLETRERYGGRRWKAKSWEEAKR